MTTSGPHALVATVSAGTLREAIGRFATGVTVVTSIAGHDEPVGTTASAVSSLSLDPPLVLVCLDRASRTLAALREHGAFAINVLTADQRDVATNFARRGQAAAWEAVAHGRGPTGCPRLDDVLAVLDCAVERCLPGGDHEIVVGRVRDVATGAEDAGPLLHYRGAYASLGGGAA
ncbi:MAG: flavin reductase family protein [Solirubrobacteraceae bacterium]|nr:flavin reductase family protein [Solirubrobacteraceae bacterium]